MDKHREDGRNGLPSVSGSGHPVGGGIRSADDRTGVILPGAKVSASTVFGVWGGDGIGVSISPPTDTVQEGNGRETALGDHDPLQRATHL